jgi:hypothetical protein
MTDRRSLTVIIQEEAEAEITLASHYYRNINPTLSLNFLREVFSKINYISVYPMAFQLRHKGYRAAFLETFPYKIVYQIGYNSKKWLVKTIQTSIESIV